MLIEITEQEILNMESILNKCKNKIPLELRPSIENRFHGLNKKTVEFCKILYAKYGNFEIEKKDKYFIKLAHDLEIFDIGSTLVSFEKRGMVSLKRKNDLQKNIISFHLIN
jgi:hypothetical protein